MILALFRFTSEGGFFFAIRSLGEGESCGSSSDAHWPVSWRRSTVVNGRVELIIRRNDEKVPAGNWLRNAEKEAVIGERHYWKITTELSELAGRESGDTKDEFLIFLS